MQDHESHLQRLTSPIIADLPLMSMRSPPLSLDFAASEVRIILTMMQSGRLSKGEIFRRSIGGENFTFTDYLKLLNYYIIGTCSMSQNFSME